MKPPVCEITIMKNLYIVIKFTKEKQQLNPKCGMIPYQSISPDFLSSLKLSREHIQKAPISRPSLPKFQH